MAPRINIPPVTRVLLGALTVQSVLDAIIRYRQWSSPGTVALVPYMVLVPQIAYIYPWTSATAALVETNVLSLAIAALSIYHAGRYLERAWSGPEFAKFIGIVAIVPNLACLFLYLFISTLTHNDQWIRTSISGSISLQISFLIALSQLIPAHTVTIFRGVLSLRVPRFPLIYVAVVILLSLIRILSATAALLSMFGFLTSWTYLRFYKVAFPDLDTSQPSSLHGDSSETFAFAEFFPAAVKPGVATASTAIFHVLVALRLCAPVSSRSAALDSMPSRAIARSAPAGIRAEAERRRALALRALDQKLHAATAGLPESMSASESIARPPAPPQLSQSQPADHQTVLPTQGQFLPNLAGSVPPYQYPTSISDEASREHEQKIAKDDDDP